MSTRNVSRYGILVVLLASSCIDMGPQQGPIASVPRGVVNGSSLNGSSLNGSSLNGSSLNGSSLNGSSLNGSSLNGSSLNGSSLNGSSLNGSSLNGSSLNGSSLNGSSLNGSSLNGSSLNGSSLNGSSFNGTLEDGTVISGTQYAGVQFTGYLSDGREIPMRIDDVEQSPADPAIYFYRVSVGTDQGWLRLCGDEADGTAIQAIPLVGGWDFATGARIDDPARMIWACRRAAIAKCVELGYKPWVSQSLQDHHQTCTRVIRADYCGNGESWTVNGRVINVYDAAGVQVDTETWTFEAEWDTAGARCVSSRRVIWLQNGSEVLPSCLAEKVAADCGAASHFTTGTLIMEEYETQYTQQL